MIVQSSSLPESLSVPLSLNSWLYSEQPLLRSSSAGKSPERKGKYLHSCIILKLLEISKLKTIVCYNICWYFGCFRSPVLSYLALGYQQGFVVERWLISNQTSTGHFPCMIHIQWTYTGLVLGSGHFKSEGREA